jgi:hypothetical protein
MITKGNSKKATDVSGYNFVLSYSAAKNTVDPRINGPFVYGFRK